MFFTLHGPFRVVLRPPGYCVRLWATRTRQDKTAVAGYFQPPAPVKNGNLLAVCVCGFMHGCSLFFGNWPASCFPGRISRLDLAIYETPRSIPPTPFSPLLFLPLSHPLLWSVWRCAWISSPGALCTARAAPFGASLLLSAPVAAATTPFLGPRLARNVP